MVCRGGVQRRMIAALLLLIPGQASGVVCLSSAQGPVCGYHCVTSRNGPACARTAAGRCSIQGNVASCVDPPEPAVPAPQPAPSPPPTQCVTQGGKTACGYGCLTFNGTAACAATPLGRCEVWQGELVCWDPPLVLTSLPQTQWKRAQCEHNFTQQACGYHCKASGDDVACARTWFGVCEANLGKVTCWDPAEPLIWSAQGDLPLPRCLQSGDAVACGYTCDHSYGQPVCTATPRGRCEKNDGNVTCWDPPLPYVPPPQR